MIKIMSVSIFNHLARLDGPRQDVAPAQFLFRQGDAVDYLYLVVKGEVHLARFLEDGSALVLQRAGPNSLLAEASLFSPYYHCDAICHSAAQIKTLRKNDVQDALDRDSHLALALSEHLAREVQRTRMHAEILRLRTVAKRLDAWLGWHDGTLPAKGSWRSIALEIGVSPEALYREIAQRRQT